MSDMEGEGRETNLLQPSSLSQTRSLTFDYILLQFRLSYITRIYALFQDGTALWLLTALHVSPGRLELRERAYTVLHSYRGRALHVPGDKNFSDIQLEMAGRTSSTTATELSFCAEVVSPKKGAELGLYRITSLLKAVRRGARVSPDGLLHFLGSEIPLLPLWTSRRSLPRWSARVRCELSSAEKDGRITDMSKLELRRVSAC